MRHLRPYLDYLAQCGVEVLGARRRKHTLVVCAYRGELFRTCIPTSPSDWRAWDIFTAGVRRECRKIDRRYTLA